MILPLSAAEPAEKCGLHLLLVVGRIGFPSAGSPPPYNLSSAILPSFTWPGNRSANSLVSRCPTAGTGMPAPPLRVNLLEPPCLRLQGVQEPHLLSPWWGRKYPVSHHQIFLRSPTLSDIFSSRSSYIDFFIWRGRGEWGMMMMMLVSKTDSELVPSDWMATGPNLCELLELVKQGYLEPFILIK